MEQQSQEIRTEPMVLMNINPLESPGECPTCLSGVDPNVSGNALFCEALLGETEAPVEPMILMPNINSGGVVAECPTCVSGLDPNVSGSGLFHEDLFDSN